jgi:branched-chain amino acid aminotransferase
MGLKVYINDRLVEDKDARVSVFDHGLLYGDGVFEGIRAYGGVLFEGPAHVARLYDSARAIALEIPMGRDEMLGAIHETVDANGLEDAYVRVVVTRGVGTLGLNPRKCPAPQVIIIAGGVTLYPTKSYRDGLRIVTASTVRNHVGALNPRIKSLNYLNNILAKIEGLGAGCDEALMLNSAGLVAECTGDNIFIVREGRLCTPPASAGILAGITRRVVMQLAAGDGMAVEETNLTRFDLYCAQECLLTGTAAEVIPVVEIDGRPVADGRPGPVTRRLMALFGSATGGRP